MYIKTLSKPVSRCDTFLINNPTENKLVMSCSVYTYCIASMLGT